MEKMTTLQKLQRLPDEFKNNLNRIYSSDSYFPFVVRYNLANWIEDKPWNELDVDNPQHETFATNLVTSFIQEIQSRSNDESLDYCIRVQLGDAAKRFSQHFTLQPFLLVNTVKQCLQSELNLINQFENASSIQNMDIMNTIPNIPQEIANRVDELNAMTNNLEEEKKKMQEEQESFFLQYQEFQKIETYMAQEAKVAGSPTGSTPTTDISILNRLKSEKATLSNELSKKANTLASMREAWLNRQCTTFELIHDLQQKVLDDELVKWKRAQQLSGNGATFENNLDTIQQWCESLADIIWKNRNQLNLVQEFIKRLPLNNNQLADRIKNLNDNLMQLLSNLVTSTYLIEKQPPQVMKTNTRFSSTVRFLVGPILHVQVSPPQVKVSIISEQQANLISHNEGNKMKESCCGDIVNNTGTMDYNPTTKQLNVNFRNMQLRKIKRAEKKGTESVMDEKFSLLFQSEFKIGNIDKPFQVFTLSLPVCVIVHGNQEPHAWATVTWDNAFAELGRAPFIVPDKVPWHRVADVLNMKVKSAIGREMTPNNLLFLAQKAFRNPTLQDVDKVCLSWSQYSKEPLPDRNFTFWEWFYAILKVTKEHLRFLWNDGNIIGFIGRKQTEEMLLQRPIGTFLLRYSDSEPGGVTIAWVAENSDSHPEVFMLQPFTSRDFAIRGLADRINDLKHLLYLYPDIPKDQAFGKYYTPINENQSIQPNGYVKPVLVTHIPGMPGHGFDSYPNTPQSAMHNPNSPGDSTFLDTSCSIRSASVDHVMNVSGPADHNMLPEMELNDLIMNMDLPPDVADEVDFSTINVNDLMGIFPTESN